MKSVIFFLAVILIMTVQVKSFAEWMTKDFCDRQLILDEIIMNSKVVESKERLIVVTRVKDDGTREVLNNNDNYIPGETLEITLSEGERKGQHVFELQSKNAKFTRGGCNGARSAKTKSSLEIDKKTSDSITIIAGNKYSK